MATVNKIEELNSFVKKFSALWAAGSDASLSLESNGGQVFVTLRLGLGEHPSKMYDTNIGNTQKKRLSPSKLRRRERRAAERLSAGSNKSADTSEKMVSVAEDTKVDSMENTIHVSEVAAEKVAAQSTQINENVAEVSKTGNYMYMTKGDQEVVAEKPIVEKTSLWAKSSSNPDVSRNVQDDLPKYRIKIPLLEP